MKFKPAKGCHLNDEQATRYGKHIWKLTKKYKGKITPEQVLEDASKFASPLHDWFEWDDTVAAEAFRRTQAAYLLRSIVVIEHEECRDDTRAFYCVNETNEEGGKDAVFVPIDRVLNENDLREQVIQYAYNELLNWRERYYKYVEFRGIVKAIDEFGVAAKVKTTKKKSKVKTTKKKSK